MLKKINLVLGKGDRLTTLEISALYLSSEQRAVSTFPVLLRHCAPALTSGTSSRESSYPIPPAPPAHRSCIPSDEARTAAQGVSLCQGLLQMRRWMTIRPVALHYVAWSDCHGQTAQQQAMSAQGICAAAQGYCSKSSGPGNTL